MNIVLTTLGWLLFWFIFFHVFPRLGLKIHRLKAVYLDPKDGKNRHYKYDPNGMRFYWMFLLICFTITFFIPFSGIAINGVETDFDKRQLIGGIGVNILLLLLLSPAIISLLLYKYNKKSGLYIYEDKIVTRGFLDNGIILKENIQSIEYKGVLLGFEMKMKNGKSNRLMGIGLDHLPQQICTLLLYVSNNRKDIYSDYDPDFLAYLDLIRENRNLRREGKITPSLRGLYQNKRHRHRQIA